MHAERAEMLAVEGYQRSRRCIERLPSIHLFFKANGLGRCYLY